MKVDEPVKVFQRIRLFVIDDHARELVEYSLLAAFVAVGAAAIFPNSVSKMSVIFSRVASLLFRAGH